MQEADHDLELLLAQAGWLRGLARRLAGEAGADDLVQEVWLKVASRPPGSIGSPRGWLARVVRNVHLRRSERHVARSEREVAVARPEALPSAGEVAERADAQRVLVAALVELDEPWRRTLLLHFFDGISAAEIARRDGQPASTIRSRIARGVDELRSRLDDRRGGREAWLPGALVLGWPKGSPPASTSAASAASPMLLSLSVVAMWKPLVLVSLALVAWFTLRPPASEPDSTAVGEANTVVVETDAVEEPGLDVAAAAQVGRNALEAVASAGDAVQEPVESEEGVLAAGTVVDPEGRPVPNATVYGGTVSAFAMEERGMGGSPGLRATTDERGRFVLPWPEEREVSLPLTLTAHASEYASSEEWIAPEEGDGGIRLQLRAGAGLAGTVYGLDGNPVEGREVQVSSPNLGEFLRVTTVEDGTFTLDALNPGPWRAATMPGAAELEAHGDGDVRLDPVGHLAQLEFDLVGGRTTSIELARVDADTPRVRGRLTRAGKPLRTLMQWYPVDRPVEKQVCQPDEAGRFEIRLPRAGRWVVHANDMGAASNGQRTSFEVRPGEDLELDVELDGREWSGRVVDASGVPVEGQWVELRSAGRTPHVPAPLLGGGFQVTDEEGRYRFELIEPGSYRAVAHGTTRGEDLGFGSAVGEAIAVAAEDVVADDLVVDRGARLRVRVTDVHGRPAAGASLWFHGPEGVPLNPQTFSHVGSAGSATSPTLPLGPVAVTAVHRSGASETRLVEVGVDEEVELRLGPLRWLEVDRSGEPLDDTVQRIGVLDGDGREWGGLIDIRRLFEARPSRDVDERPLFGPLPLGRYRVTVGESTTTVDLGPDSPLVTTATVH